MLAQLLLRLHYSVEMDASQLRKGASLTAGLLSVATSPRRWGVFTEAWQRTAFDRAFSVSFAQGAEDLALLALMSPGPEGRYLDIGAHDPDRFSVTRLLYDRGWSGVNVDANIQVRARFGARRPRDNFVHALVGTPQEDEDSRTFWVFEEPALSTSDTAWRDSALEAGEAIAASVQVPVVSLEHLMTKFFGSTPPDLLVVDTEGTDLEVLESNNWTRFRPAWVVVETPVGVTQALDSGPVAFLTSCGYAAAAVLPMSTVLTTEPL